MQKRKEIAHCKRQISPGYCSPILLLNVFNDVDYEHFIDNPRFFGSGDQEWKEMIEYKLPQFAVDDIAYVNQNFGKGALPCLLIDQVINTPIKTNEQLAIVYYFLTVKRIGTLGDMWHSTAILNVNGTLWYSDPYNESMFTFNSVCDLVEFSKCHRIQTLIHKETQSVGFLRGECIFGSKVLKILKDEEA